MKHNNLIITGTAALVALVAVSGIAFISYAADSEDPAAGSEFKGRMMGERFSGMSAEAKAEKEVQRIQFQAQREAERAVRQATIASGDYDAWLETVPADAPIREKINAGNFQRFSAAHGQIADGQTILRDELGIERGDMGQKGFGRGMGKGRMMGGCPMAGGLTADQLQ